MLGKANYHEQVPRRPDLNLRYRQRIVAACRNNPEMQRACIEVCKRDLLFFVNVFVWQYNPLIKGVRSVGPFITWKFQEKVLTGDRGILWCYENNMTGVVEKSRDMGASWMFLFVQVWLAMFHENVATFNISRSADAVDSNTKNSLFEKIRFIHSFLPDWMTKGIDDTKFRFKYDLTNSEITGEASTGQAGTGGRAGVIFVDEFPEIKAATKVRQNTASIADCRFFNGTHLGVGTEFYLMTKSPEFVHIQMHWTRHPRKNKQMYSWDTENNRVRYWKYDERRDAIVETAIPEVSFPPGYDFDRTGTPVGGPHPGIRSVWYDKKAKEIGTTRQVAMELDINPSGSSSQFYEPLVITTLMNRCVEPKWRGTLMFDEQFAVPRRLVEGEGPLAFWINPLLTADGTLCKVQPGRYVAGCDVALGVGATPSCISMFDIDRGFKVMSWSDNRTDVRQFARIAVSLCRLFTTVDESPALLAWEANGAGTSFGNEVTKELNFRNVYWRKDEYSIEERETNTPGWVSTPKTRFDLHTQYHLALKTGMYVNLDRAALEETLSYAHANGSVEHSRAASTNDESAAGANHGDMVVADAISWFVAKKYTRIELGKQQPDVVVPNSILGRRMLREKLERESAKW